MSLGDSGALTRAGELAAAAGAPPDCWPRYLTSNTIATTMATTKTIMNMSITQPSQPAPWPDSTSAPAPSAMSSTLTSSGAASHSRLLRLGLFFSPSDLGDGFEIGDAEVVGCQ